MNVRGKIAGNRFAGNLTYSYKFRSLSSLRLLWFTAMCCFVCALSAGEFADEFITAAGLNPDGVSVKIINLSNGDVIESHNSELPLIPASITKAVTIASLSKVLPLDYRYSTHIYMTGKVKNGMLDGNLLIVGSGDPTVNAPCGPASADIIGEIADALKINKVDSIRGRIVINQDIFPGPAQSPLWGPGDLKQSYGAGCFGFNFLANRSGKSSIANPASVFEQKLIAGLLKNGIKVMGEDVEMGKETLIVNHKSAPLDEIMRSCMMRSDNLYAEAMLRSFALARGEKGTTTDGTKQELDYWKRNQMPMNGVNIVDGSGLSRSNRITADFMAAVLKNMSDNVYYASFFPLAGQEGTLRKFLAGTPLDGYIAMKTGSMTGIQCYAGYKLDDDYAPTHVVVIMMNDITGSRDKAKSAAADMLLKIFKDE